MGWGLKGREAIPESPKPTPPLSAAKVPLCLSTPAMVRKLKKKTPLKISDMVNKILKFSALSIVF